MGSFELTTVDLIVMSIYAVFIIGYGLFSAKAQSSEEYFLAGRNMTWPIVGISLFAANISSSTHVGLAGAAYKTNTQVYYYEIALPGPLYFCYCLHFGGSGGRLHCSWRLELGHSNGGDPSCFTHFW